MDTATAGLRSRKSGFVILAVIFMCFSAIYPRIIHPMLFVPFSAYKSTAAQQQQIHGGHPHLEARCSGDNHRERTACTEQLFQPNQAPPMPPAQTRQKSLWASLLPFYSIGVIAFLLYTLAKTMLNDRDVTYQPNASTKHTEYRGCMTGMSDSELKQLREQLVDTEAAMLRLLKSIEKGELNMDTVNHSFQDTLIGLKELTERATMKLANQNGDKPSDQSADNAEYSIDVLVNEFTKVLEQIRSSKKEEDRCMVSDAVINDAQETKKSV